MSKWIKFIVLSGATVLLQLYDFWTAPEASPQLLAILQYGLFSVALFAFVGSIVMFVKERREDAPGSG